MGASDSLKEDVHRCRTVQSLWQANIYAVWEVQICEVLVSVAVHPIAPAGRASAAQAHKSWQLVTTIRHRPYNKPLCALLQ